MSETKAQQTLSQHLPMLAPAAAGEPFNFISEVLSFLSRWCNTYTETGHLSCPAYCCFIGVERVASEAPKHTGCTERLHFREDTPQDLLGTLYLCSFPLAQVFGIARSLASLSECEAALQSTGLSSAPVVMFNAAERRVFWRTAAGELRQGTFRASQETKLKSTELDKGLKDFHIEYTETPQGLTKPWASAKKFITKPELEAEIRDALYVYFRHLVKDQFAVFREFYGSAGRTDLLLLFRDEDKYVYIELKVLRGYKANGRSRAKVPVEESVDWGKKGIAQAHCYKRSCRGLGIAYACCFDAREKNKEIKALVELAQQLDVCYRRFFMHNSAEKLHRSLMN